MKKERIVVLAKQQQERIFSSLCWEGKKELEISMARNRFFDEFAKQTKTDHREKKSMPRNNNESN